MGFFVSGRGLCRIFDSAELWHRYRKSMCKRRPGSELPHNRFGRHIRRYASAFVEGESAIVGFFKDDTFVVSHFCPAGQKSGVEALKSLRRRTDVQVIFAVTEDMVSMLQRLGYKVLGTAPARFRGEECVKTLLTNR